ncbi:TRAF3-interacting protein 1 [Athalia rosae]|uniref:TRAF3-interacting protein 1 n=1 Tax=Athalia rosae TaxID=37344 RepID=UPI00203460A2|nr:TRAF3-interacting protein 1 [Athalia rosae]
MTEDVRPEVIKKTQDLLGKYFKKPPLTDKLLKKPPFRFLHDIVSSVIKETGFLDGLFSEDELNSDNIKDKDAKLSYLTKLIDVVKLITGSNLTVRPNKIISGHEPIKTNELLQAIGKALDKKVSSVEAIEHYKNGSSGTKGPGKPKLATKKPTSRQSSQVKKSIEKEKPLADQRKKSTSISKGASKESKAHSEDRHEKHREQEKENKAKGTAGNDEKLSEMLPAEPVEEKHPSSVRRQKSSRSIQPNEDPLSPKTLKSANGKPALSDATNSPTHRVEDSSSNDIKPDVETPKQSQQDIQDLEMTIGSTSDVKHSAELRARRVESSKGYKNKEDSNLLSPSHKIHKSATARNKIEKQHTFDNPGSPPPKSVSTLDDSMNISNIPEPTVVRPKTSLRPPSSRPISARPAAPRVRSKAEFIFNEDITTPLGTVNVIVENFDTKEDDDIDDMVVVETIGSGDSLNVEELTRTESRLSEEHGHLVAQILETQRELINTDNVDVMPKKVEIEWEAGARRDRGSTIKEVDKMRSSIQTLTRATNPLGKLLDYLQEDVEMMQKELQEWRTQYNKLSEQLQQEHILTQESIEPMKGTLSEIEENIKVQSDKICQAKASITKNDRKLQRLLNG